MSAKVVHLGTSNILGTIVGGVNEREEDLPSQRKLPLPSRPYVNCLGGPRSENWRVTFRKRLFALGIKSQRAIAYLGVKKPYTAKRVLAKLEESKGLAVKAG